MSSKKPGAGKVPTVLQPTEETSVKLSPVPVTAKEIDNAAERAVADETEESLRTLGQRKINFIWEVTQGIIAVSVTLSTLSVCAYLVLNGEGETGAFLLLSNIFFLVVSVYFQRTNHTKIGGVGKSDLGR